MQYFDSLPKVVYRDKNGNLSLRTNLLARASFIPETLKNPMLYYQYDIQEGDTPEIVAHKYYNDMYRYWIVLFANEMMDPNWNWPLSTRDFNRYMESKYPEQQTHGTVHHYEKILTQYDANTDTTTINKVTISENEYNSIIEGTNTFELPTGPTSIKTEKRIVSVYDYELELNESKRSINLLNSSYVDEMELQLKMLMAA